MPCWPRGDGQNRNGAGLPRRARWMTEKTCQARIQGYPIPVFEGTWDLGGLGGPDGRGGRAFPSSADDDEIFSAGIPQARLPQQSSVAVGSHRRLCRCAALPRWCRRCGRSLETMAAASSLAGANPNCPARPANSRARPSSDRRGKWRWRSAESRAQREDRSRS